MNDEDKPRVGDERVIMVGDVEAFTGSKEEVQVWGVHIAPYDLVSSRYQYPNYADILNDGRELNKGDVVIIRCVSSENSLRTRGSGWWYGWVFIR